MSHGLSTVVCILETAAADGASRVGSVRGSHGRAKRPQLPLGAWTVSHDSIAARERQERANFPSDLARATSVRSCSHVTGSSRRDGAMGACCMLIFDLALLLSYPMLGRTAHPRWSSGSPQKLRCTLVSGCCALRAHHVHAYTLFTQP